MLDKLKEVTLFKGLEADELEVLESLFELYRCPAGTVIFQQGYQAVYLYLILNGIVEIRHKPYDGPPITVTRVLQGGAFGWSAAIGNEAYTSGAICDEELVALRIAGNDLRKFFIKYPDTGKIILDRLARVVSNRWQDALAQVRTMMVQNIPDGIALQGSQRRKMSMTAASNHSKEEQLQRLIEQLSAYIEQFHGGSVEYISFDGKILKVRLGGACLGCPLSPATLQGWVAGTVHQFFPDIDIIESKFE